MATITLKGTEIQTSGDLPEIGTNAPSFSLIKNDLTASDLSDYKGYNVILNIFPSIDTGICAASVRKFNEEASQLPDTKVLCISRDLPFAHSRFCGAEGLENVISLSDFKDGSFGKDYGLEIATGPFAGLHSRVVMVLDKKGVIIYKEQVPEIAQEPDYQKALRSLN